MLSILASCAQEESRNVSENCKWRVRKMFADGRPNGDNMIGYRLVDGVYQIVPDEAKTVKLIFELTLSGMGREAVCKRLNSMGLKTRRGYEWAQSTLYQLLRNEKYTGNMLLQKTYIKDHLSKKKVVNKGELQQYFITNSHEAIISQDTFDRVQNEIAKRAAHFRTNQPKNTLNVYPFTSKIRCGLCGCNYRRKTIPSGVVWICTTYNRKGKAACPSKQIPENVLLDIGDFSQIHVTEPNAFIIVRPDGTEIEWYWQDRSRRESWTEDKREIARNRQLEIIRKGMFYT